MAVVATQLTSGSSETDATSYASASISPSANRLILAVVSGTNSPGPVNTPTASGAGLTWVQVANVADSTVTRRITLFRAMSATPGSGAVTFSFGGQTQLRGHWSITEFVNVDTTGTNGSGAIVQSATNSNSGTQTGITVTLGAFGSADNATYGAARKNSTATMTEGSGFTQLAEIDADGAAFNVMWKNSNDTGVDWTWASESAVTIALATEIKAGAVITNSDSGNPIFFSGGLGLG